MPNVGYINNLLQPLAYWIANCDEHNMPQPVRCLGVTHDGKAEEITAFIPEVWSEKFLQNLQHNHKLTLIGTDVPTYESYQYKGKFVKQRPCTEEEVTLQHRYLSGFCDEVEKIGLSWQGFYNSYFHQPSLAITFKVTDIFNQTPHKGTGCPVKAIP